MGQNKYKQNAQNILNEQDMHIRASLLQHSHLMYLLNSY